MARSSATICLVVLAMLALSSFAAAASDRMLLQQASRDAREIAAQQQTQKVIRQATRQNSGARTQNVAQQGTSKAQQARPGANQNQFIAPTQG